MKKLFPWLVSLLLAIALIALVALYFWNTLFGTNASKDPDKAAIESVEDVKAEPLSADEMLLRSSELMNIKTNLADADYVVLVSFVFQLDSVKAKEAFEKIKEIQIKPIVNRALWVMSPEDMSGTKGKDQLTAGLINSINAVFAEGKVTKVDIKDFIITPV